MSWCGCLSASSECCILWVSTAGVKDHVGSTVPYLDRVPLAQVSLLPMILSISGLLDNYKEHSTSEGPRVASLLASISRDALCSSATRLQSVWPTAKKRLQFLASFLPWHNIFCSLPLYLKLHVVTLPVNSISFICRAGKQLLNFASS